MIEYNKQSRKLKIDDEVIEFTQNEAKVFDMLLDRYPRICNIWRNSSICIQGKSRYVYNKIKPTDNI